MVGDIEKMIAVGLVWGATNAIMRRGALLWDQALKSSSSSKPTGPSDFTAEFSFPSEIGLSFSQSGSTLFPF
ncbi:hypothetical protein L6164_005237 [Bauhinia variegata]|uniref:Uncharacterized protein n=1 Tax=Bauhinia variegata TaxID=167791 RepID=A0ACB9PW44_BAUVA|nr:hypothetical protein L6164_005237 [Bauhinia variegata]